MSSSRVSARFAGALLCFAMTLFSANGVQAAACPKPLADSIPKRTARAPSGSELMAQLHKVGGSRRDAAVVNQVLAGNLPGFLRQLTPVEFVGSGDNGEALQITICVTPEYLAVGDNADYVRVPMGLGAAARIANELGFLLPTTKMVDAIYRQAEIRLTPRPMEPTSQMESTAYLLEHNRLLEAQRAEDGQSLSDLTAGQKKDIVLTKRLLSKPGRVPIYGWHRPNGKPIQPLSTVHGAGYADYSHGVRLVSRTAYVNGKPRDLAEIIQDDKLAHLVSSEGPIKDPARLLARQY